MKIEAGKIYTLVKAPSMFKGWQGHKFKVTNITKEEVTLEEVTEDTDYGASYTCVVVSPDEFEIYFKPVEVKPVKLCKAGKWSEWTTIRTNGVSYAYKTNGKKVIVRSNGYRGESSCHSEDKFELEIGLKMAIDRLNESKPKRPQKKTIRFEGMML